MIDGHVVADFSGLADHHSGGVIDEQSVTRTAAG